MTRYLQDINKEFEEFKNAEGITPPASLSEKILGQVRRDLNPNAWSVFAKLSLVHLFTGVITLTVCPQFGIRFFGEGLGLMRYFLSLGTYGCIVVCGAFFLGSSLMVSGLFLKPEELKVVRRLKWLQLAALASLSLGFFVMLDVEILLSFALAWVIGSVLGGTTGLELGWMIRRRFVYR